MSDNKPVAWAVALGDEGMVLDGIYISKAKADEVLEWRNENTEYGARLIPLYGSPDCPYVTGTVTRYCSLTPFTLTDAEREAVDRQAKWLFNQAKHKPDIHSADLLLQEAATLRGLLERTRNGTLDGCETVR